MFCGSLECCLCRASTKGQHHVTKQQLRGGFCDSHRRCNTYQWGRNCARYPRQHDKLHCDATSKVQVGRDKRELKLPVLRQRFRHVSYPLFDFSFNFAGSACPKACSSDADMPKYTVSTCTTLHWKDLHTVLHQLQ